MTNYFQVALIGSTWSWLMNLLEVLFGSLKELCCQFVSNFESTYSRLDVELDLHDIQQQHGRPCTCLCIGLSLNTIPRITSSLVVNAFCQAMRDGKMLQKIAIHNIQDVEELLTLPDKCARAIEGRAWHTPRDIQLGQLGLYGPRSSYTKPQKKKASGAHQVCVAAQGGELSLETNVQSQLLPQSVRKHCHISRINLHDLTMCMVVKDMVEHFNSEQARGNLRMNLKRPRIGDDAIRMAAPVPSRQPLRAEQHAF